MLGIINIFGISVDEEYFTASIDSMGSSLSYGAKCYGFLVPLQTIQDHKELEYCFGKTTDRFDWPEENKQGYW